MACPVRVSALGPVLASRNSSGICAWPSARPAGHLRTGGTGAEHSGHAQTPLEPPGGDPGMPLQDGSEPSTPARLALGSGHQRAGVSVGEHRAVRHDLRTKRVALSRWEAKLDPIQFSKSLSARVVVASQSTAGDQPSVQMLCPSERALTSACLPVVRFSARLVSEWAPRACRTDELLRSPGPSSRARQAVLSRLARASVGPTR